MYSSELHELIQILTPNEKEEFKISITKNGLLVKQTSLTGKLFDLLATSNKKIDNKILIKKLYKSSNSEANFRKLVYRTRNKILDFLANNFSIENINKIDEAVNAKQNVLKKILAFQILFYKGQYIKLLNTLLEEILATSIQYEFYPILIEYLFFKKILLGVKEGDKTFKEFDNKIQFYSRCYIALNKAVEMNHQLKYIDGKTSSNHYKNNVQKEIEVLRKETFNTKSIQIEYYKLYHEFTFFNINLQYKKARTIGYKILKLINENIVLKRKERLGIVYAHITLTEIHLQNYKQAFECIEYSKLYLNQNTRNYFLILENEFLCNFYS
nr:hypothetical protein [Flavobacteriales bacterium]